MTTMKRDFGFGGWSGVKDLQCENVDPCGMSVLLLRRGTHPPDKERRKSHPGLTFCRLTHQTTLEAAPENQRHLDGLNLRFGEKNPWQEWHLGVLDM